MKKVIITVITIIIAGSLTGQEVKKNKRSYEWTIREKIKLDVHAIKDHLSVDGIDESDTKFLKTLKFTDVPIVTSSAIDAEVHAAVNPIDSNNIVVSPIRQTSSGMGVPIYYTKDFGSSWQKSSFNAMPSAPSGYTMGGGDPVFVYDASGKLYFTYIDLFILGSASDTLYWNLRWAYSDDGGQTWTRPTNDIIASTIMITATSTFIGDLPDKQWMATDRSGTIFDNSLYVSYASINATTGHTIIKVKHLREDSLSFNNTEGVVNNSSFVMSQFASLDVDNLGAVHVTFFGSVNGNDYGVYHSVSVDGGVTFSTPVKICNIQMPGYSAGQSNQTIPGIKDDRIYPAVYFEANHNSGELYVTWTANGLNTKLNNGLDIWFSASTDGGTNWTTPKVVNDNIDTIGSHQFYSSITIGNDGNVVLGWYDRRNDTANLITDYYFSESSDNGNTFTPAYQVTTQPTDFSKVGIANNDFGIGEYTQILALKDYIIPVWTDGRTNNGNLNIYCAFINRKTMSVESFSQVDEILKINNIYPNPASDIISADISLSEISDLSLLIIDQQGRIVKTENYGKQPVGDHTFNTEVSSLSAGKYFIMIKGGAQLFAHKIIVL